MESSTSQKTRFVIWVITIVMVVGFLGSFFLVFMENEDSSTTSTTATTTTSDETETETELVVDPTAYTVEGTVDSLQITDLTVGTGEVVETGDTVEVDYKATIAQTGEKIGSSYDDGETIDIEVSTDSIIEGVAQGMVGMQVGGKRRIIIPASMAYGDVEYSGVPANSDLVFEIEVLSIVSSAS